MEKQKYYITTAIAYTSGKPHIGNTYEAVLADAKKRADAEIARREAEADKGRAAIDEEFAQREARESERMDGAYLDAKHALDNAFEAGHDAWLAEITQNTLAAL